MLLEDIASVLGDVSPLQKQKQAIINKIRDAKNTVNDLKQRALSLQQAGRSNQYDTQIKRASTQLQVLQDELKALEPRATATQASREFDRQYAEKRANETPEDRKARFGKAVGVGLNVTNELRQKFGGWEGLAGDVLAYVRTATSEGQERVTADDIAHKYGTLGRTVNKWLERPEFWQTARLLGRR